MLARIGKTLLLTCALCAGGAALGLAFNAVRPGGLPLVAPFAYQQDCPEKIDLSAPSVSAARARALLADRQLGAALLDARPEEDYRAAHLPGALSLPLSFSSPPGPNDVKHLRRHGLVIVYGDSPEDRIARLQAERLRKAGLPHVTVLAGGFEGFGKPKGGAGGAR